MSEQLQRYCVRNSLHARIGRMQVVSAVVGGQQAGRMFRITKCPIEIDNSIETLAICEQPLIDGLPLRLFLCGEVAGVWRAFKGKYGAYVDPYAVCVGANRKLLKCGFEILWRHGFRHRLALPGVTEIIDSFEHYDM